jgi:hypothetical protein
MREGHISSEEVDSTLARFVPGLGRLLLLGGGRFIFVAQGCQTFDFSDELSKAATNRDFFLACIERWFAAGTKPDLVAGVINIKSTAVLAIGRLPVSVKTGEASGRVDPSLASFAAEQVFQGRLVSIAVGDVTQLGSNHPTTPCWAASGLLPVDAFLLLPFNGETLKRPANPISSQVAGVPGVSGEAQAQTPAESRSVLAEVKVAPDLYNELVQEPRVTEPNSIEGAPRVSSPSIVPEQSIPVVTADFATNYDEFDELLDGATVWPAAGRNRSSPVQAGEPIAVVPPPDTISETQGFLVSEEKVAASRKRIFMCKLKRGRQRQVQLQMPGNLPHRNLPVSPDLPQRLAHSQRHWGSPFLPQNLVCRLMQQTQVKRSRGLRRFPALLACLNPTAPNSRSWLVTLLEFGRPS